MQARGDLWLGSLVAAITTGALVLGGCSGATNAVLGISPSTTTATVPVSLTDAPSDVVLATSLTLNTVTLTNSKGATVSVLSSPLTFEATRLDAVQEPLMMPAIPEDTYTSVALTYSNAQVAYVDTATKQVVTTAGVLANNSQTITFPNAITVSNSSTGLLVDYLVANSVVISGSTVTVTPQFHVAAVPVSSTPTNGTNGLMVGVKGKVSALGTNSFTLTLPHGVAVTAEVNSNTVYQGISNFAALTVGALIEADLTLKTDGTILATRVEQAVAPVANMIFVEGPITAITGSPASSFTMAVRDKVGATATTAPIENDTITITGSTKFVVPARFATIVAGVTPFTQDFSAATLFAGQAVTVATTGVTNNAATALAIEQHPQTVGGTIASITPPVTNNTQAYTVYVVTLDPTGWLAKLTGKSSVTVYINENPNVQAINNTTFTVGQTARFNGFLYQVNGNLVLLAGAQADGAGTPIGPHI
jgi:hypothetical protein